MMRLSIIVVSTNLRIIGWLNGMTRTAQQDGDYNLVVRFFGDDLGTNFLS
jgi:hypothetical protein